MWLAGQENGNKAAFYSVILNGTIVSVLAAYLDANTMILGWQMDPDKASRLNVLKAYTSPDAPVRIGYNRNNLIVVTGGDYDLLQSDENDKICNLLPSLNVFKAKEVKHMDSGKDIREAVVKYSDTLYKICIVILCNEYDVQDAIQDTFCRYLEKKPEFRDEENEKTWLIRVAANICRDMIRFRVRHPKVSIDDQRLNLSVC